MSGETPEADWQEQQQPVRPFEVGSDGETARQSSPAEADDADRLDQARPVPIDEDEADGWDNHD